MCSEPANVHPKLCVWDATRDFVPDPNEFGNIARAVVRGSAASVIHAMERIASCDIQNQRPSLRVSLGLSLDAM